MGNKSNKQKGKINNKVEVSSGTLSCLRLPDGLVDNSYDYRGKNVSLVDWVMKTKITLDFTKNEDQLKQFKNHDFASEFKVLQALVDYNPETKKRFYETLYMEKNRYSDIFPFSDNRVVIGKNEFINASKIHIPFNNAFIAAQGPLDESIEDFWQMVYESNSRLILMLCEVIEGNRSKCAHYWPKFLSQKQQNKLLFGNGYSVEIVSEKQLTENLTERNIILKCEAKNESREITHLHFRNWPDHGVPDTIPAFEAFELINHKIDENTEVFKGLSPVVAHCSAGVGRTGTAIAIYCLNHIYNKCVKENKIEIVEFSVFNIVRQLKEQRIYMVQTNTQYEMIYLLFELFIKKKLLKE